MSGAEASGGSVDSATAVPLPVVDNSRDSERVSTKKRRASSADSQDFHPDVSEKRRKLSAAQSCLSLVDSGEAEEKPVKDANDVIKPDYIQDYLTGRRIYATDAIAVIRRIRSGLSADDPFHDISWKTKQKDSGYVCKVKIPEILPVPSFTGILASSPPEAENMACFSFCKKLSALSLLDHKFFPRGEQSDEIKQDASPASQAAGHDVSKSSSSTRRYPRKQSSFLSNTLTLSPYHLFPLIVRIEELHGQVHSAVLILARAPFPQLGNFRVFSCGSHATVTLQRGTPFDIAEEQLSLLHRYTLRVSRAAVNKPMECAPGGLPFFFAPLAVNWEGDAETGQEWWRLPIVENHIPWDDVQLAAENWATSLVNDDNPLTEAMVEDCLLQDRAVEFTNRHYAIKLRQDLTPLSKPEDGIVSVLGYYASWGI